MSLGRQQQKCRLERIFGIVSVVQYSATNVPDKIFILAHNLLKRSFILDTDKPSQQLCIFRSFRHVIPYCIHDRFIV